MILKKNTKIYLLSLIFFVLLIPDYASASHTLEDKQDHNYPRLANYYLKWKLDENTARELAQWDLVVLDMENQVNNPNLIRKMRRWNEDIVILAYITPQEIKNNADSNPSVGKMRYRLAQGLHDEWYLKNSFGKKLSWWPGTTLLNVTDRAPKVNGQQLNDYMSSFVVDEVLSTNLWDGVFYDNSWDNITYFAGENVDTDGDGSRDNPNAANQAWINGMKSIYEKTRAKTNQHIILVGNNETYKYADELNGMMLENFSSARWQKFMNRYKYNSNKRRDPNFNLLNSNTDNTGDKYNYRKMRYGLSSALMEEGYYSFDYGDKDHGQTWWYDEYEIGLGEPIEEPEARQGGEKYEGDIWQRQFENGLVVANSTPKTQTINLGAEYEHIHGESSVNDGSIKSTITVQPHDGRVLLKTFDKLNNTVFTNGYFARFFDQQGNRVRNGFFTFEDKYDGGDKIAHIDLNGNGEKDLVTLQGNKLQAFRDDGLLYMKIYPYTARYQGDIELEVGDLNGDGNEEVFVAPKSGTKPIKVYNRFGTQIREDWYPFGKNYDNGYSISVGDFGGKTNHLVVGAGEGSSPFVQFYTHTYKPLQRWNAFEKSFKGGVSIATGDLDGIGIEEVIIGAGSDKKPIIKTFKPNGEQLSEFTAYSSFFERPGIKVKSYDVDFDEKDEIVGVSEGVGF